VCICNLYWAEPIFFWLLGGDILKKDREKGILEGGRGEVGVRELRGNGKRIWGIQITRGEINCEGKCVFWWVKQSGGGGGGCRGERLSGVVGSVLRGLLTDTPGGTW